MKLPLLLAAFALPLTAAGQRVWVDNGVLVSRMVRSSSWDLCHAPSANYNLSVSFDVAPERFWSGSFELGYAAMGGKDDGIMREDGQVIGDVLRKHYLYVLPKLRVMPWRTERGLEVFAEVGPQLSVLTDDRSFEPVSGVVVDGYRFRRTMLGARVGVGFARPLTEHLLVGARGGYTYHFTRAVTSPACDLSLSTWSVSLSLGYAF